ncbi:hypothetical protein PIB30_100352, partial [Stylosanthes scabra]|nr:hypothetical protein [Stylosanthes scabra]
VVAEGCVTRLLECRGVRVRHWRLVDTRLVTHGWAAALHHCMSAVGEHHDIGGTDAMPRGRAATLGQRWCRWVALRHWPMHVCRW